MDMKVFAYSCRDDEKPIFEELQETYGFELGVCKTQPTMENAELAKGYPCVTIVGTKISDELLRKLHEGGMQCLALRCVGYDHVNLELARELGVKVSNISYSPNAVADFAILLMMMCLRKVNYIRERYRVHDYSLAYSGGRELRDMTVGIVGGGRIGGTVIRQLSGFGCKILLYSRHKKEEKKRYAEYVSYEELLSRSDIISYHTPGTAETYHMLNLENIKKVKKGAIIINTSRGTNVDNKALIYGLEHGLIGAAGLDVIDEEPTIYNIDHKDGMKVNPDVAVLESYLNVIITPHVAFLTDHATRDMVSHGIDNCLAFAEDRPIPGEIV